ncbi:CPBP family intramembrane glutamic endopeptidase [Bacillus taeanensis]|nr:CPBP family intramembrane glutamic endopeptidase [Bacillus taeanensis]
MNNQAEMIRKMTNRQVLLNVYVTQGFLGTIALGLGIILFESWQQFYELFTWHPVQFLFLGCGSALLVILLDVVLVMLLDEKHYDDGGINKRIFSVLPVWHIAVLTIMIGAVEEILFRGVLQTHIGYFPASVLFALIHIRYLRKPVLLVSSILVSFFLGWLFLKTSNLNITIIAHFLIDFSLGCIIRFQYKKTVRVNEEDHNEVCDHESSSNKGR